MHLISVSGPKLISVSGQLSLQGRTAGLLEAPGSPLPRGGTRVGSQRAEPEVANSEPRYPTAETTACDAT